MLQQKRKTGVQKADWRSKFSNQKEELKDLPNLWYTPKYANLLDQLQTEQLDQQIEKVKPKIVTQLELNQL